MTNANYRRGTYAEYRLLTLLADRGYWVERAYASRGTFDIIAVRPTETLLIQVKRSKRRIVSTAAVRTAYADDLFRVGLVRPSLDTHLLLALYTDRQKGERAGTWRFFRVPVGAETIEEVDL